jgi:hypothetical protein
MAAQSSSPLVFLETLAGIPGQGLRSLPGPVVECLRNFSNVNYPRGCT